MVTQLKSTLTQAALKTILDYDHETGVFTWREFRSRGAYPGDEAGTIRPDKHISIVIRNRPYTAQRLAWLYMTGEWPPDRVTFRDGNPSNTSWGNLVLARDMLADTRSARYQRDLRKRRKAYLTDGSILPPDPELMLRQRPPRRLVR